VMDAGRNCRGQIGRGEVESRRDRRKTQNREHRPGPYMGTNYGYVSVSYLDNCTCKYYAESVTWCCLFPGDMNAKDTEKCEASVKERNGIRYQ